MIAQPASGSTERTRWPSARLKVVAEVMSSNVDKLTSEGQVPVLLCNYVDVYKNEHITSDIPFMAATATNAQVERFALREGDVIITKDSESPDDIAVPALVESSAEGVVCGYHLAILRPRTSKISGRFLFWALKAASVSSQFSVRAQGITRFGLSVGALGDVRVPLPPLVEQPPIADFLDRETAKIDALLQKHGAVRALLEEHRRALITAAVSGSPTFLRSEPQMGAGDFKPVRLRSVLRRIEQGWSPQCENRPADPDEWGVLKVGCVNGGSFDPDENKALPPDLEALPELEIQSGDLLVSRANTLALVGSAALVKATRTKLLLCDKLYRLTLRRDRILPEFLTYVLGSGPARHFIEAAATGASPSMKNISQDAIRDLPVPLPSIDTQAAVVRHLDDRLAEIDLLDRRSVEMIQRLCELRIALVTGAVEGHIDVGGVAKPSAVAANDNRQTFRALVGAEIVSRHGSVKTFGRVKLQKLLYLAEVHAGVHELGGTYTREAAGPLARDLLSDAERGMAVAGYYNTVPPVGSADGYTYSRIGKAGAHRDQFEALLGARAAVLRKLTDLLRDYDTRQVEAITTLYAVWNDALLNGETPDDDRIIRGVLEEWHPEKPDKFTAANLKTWLAWMRRNGLIPAGSGPRTQIDRLFV